MHPLFLTGIFLSLGTAVFWAVSPLCWASAGRRIGSLSVLYLRTWGASAILVALLPAYLAVNPGARIMPGMPQLLWMSISGLVGLVIGDALCYEAMVLLGPRRTTQAGALAPVTAVAAAWLAMDESLGVQSLLGVALVVAATFYAVTARHDPGGREPGAVTGRGVILAALGAMAVGIGAVTGRQAFRAGPLDAYVGTTIRMAGSGVMLLIVALLRGDVRGTCAHLRSGFVLSRIVPGIMAGPVIGMICYVTALKHMEAGLVSTVVSMSPLFILPMISFRYQSRIGWRVVAATVAALAGVAVICL